MNLPAKSGAIPPMSPGNLARVRALESAALQEPQINIETEHVFHAGTYARTIKVPAGFMITGALIQIPTVLIVSGHTRILVGDTTIDVDGYRVFTGSAGRKQAFVAFSDTFITMIFATDAKTVEEAEAEFTAEGDLLGSRREGNRNVVVTSGGDECQDIQQ